MIVLLFGLEIFTVFVQKMVCDKFFEKKNNKFIYGTAVWTSFFVLFNVLTYMEFVSVFVNAVVFVALFLAVLEILYQGRLKKKIQTAVFMYLLGMGSEFLVYQGGSAIGVGVEETMVAGESRLLCAIISKLVWFTGVRVALLVWKERQDADVKLIDWLAALLVPVSSMFIAVAVIELHGGRESWIKFVAACLILLLNLLTFYLYDRVQENAVSQAEKEYVKRQSGYYARLNEEIGQYWFEMKAFKHDLKQRYLLEQSYLQQGDYDRLAECYEESINILKRGKTVADTGNVCVDNIINYKALLAEKKGIEVCANLMVAYDIALNVEDICGLLGNLLDNAIEAVEEVEDDAKMIKIKMKISGQNMLITTENPYRKPRKKRGDKYVTTKTETGHHGVGLRIVEEIVKKYHGEMVIEDRERMFVVKILLCGVYQMV